MACGNNSVRRSALQSQPQQTSHPRPSDGAQHHRTAQVVQERTAAATSQVARSEDRVRSARSLQDVASAVSDAKSALDSARRAGDRAATRSLERKVADLVRSADRKSSELVQRADDQRGHLIATQILMSARLDRLAPQNLGVAYSAPPPPPPPPKETPADAPLKNAPDERSDDAAGLLGDGTQAHVDYAAFGSVDSRDAEDRLGEWICDAWAHRYEESLPNAADLVTFTDSKGFVYLYDIASSGNTASRVVGVFGRVTPDELPRDEPRIAHHKFKRSAEDLIDRGHFVAHQLGGSDEGHNLFGQVSDVNQKGLWRQLERELATQPGQLIFVRAVYTDDSDRPAGLEHGHVTREGDVYIAQFLNS
jgi:hypothetical protein